MGFTPQIVGGTEHGDGPGDNDLVGGKVVRLRPEPNLQAVHAEGQDPLANDGEELLDKDFGARIHQILETVESLENTHSKDRQQVWQEGRREHGIKLMKDSELKETVMNTDLSIINTKPVYFTALCGEIMERVIGNVARII